MQNKVMTLDEFESMPADRNSNVMTLDDFNSIEHVPVTVKTAKEKSLFSRFSEGVDIGVGGIPSAAGEALIFFGSYIRENSDETIFGTKPLVDSKPLGDRIVNIGKRMYLRNQEALQKNYPDMQERDFIRDLGTGATSLAFSLGVGATAGPAAAGVAFGASAATGGFVEATVQGKDYEEAAKIAGMLGFAEGGLEFVGINRLLKSSGGMIKRAVKGYITEFSQEFSQSLAGNIIRTASGLREFNNQNDLIDIMSDALYEGSIGGILGGAASVPISIAQRQTIEDGFKQMGVKPAVAREMADTAFKKGMDDVISVVEAMEIGLPDGASELLKSESGKLEIPDLPFMAQEKQEEIYQKSFNRFQSIENIVARAKSLGAKILPGEDAGISADRYLSIGKQAESVLNDGTYEVTKEGGIKVTGEGLRPILREFDAQSIERDADIRNQELNDYLIAKRTIEDLQRPAEKGGKNIVTNEQVQEAQSRLDELIGKYGESIAIFDSTAQRIYDYQKRVLSLLVNSGNLSQQQYDSILELNKNYIPFDRVLPEGESFAGVPMLRKRFSGAKSPIKKIKGSELEIHDPIESIIKNTYVIMERASRNKVFNDIYSLKPQTEAAEAKGGEITAEQTVKQGMSAEEQGTLTAKYIDEINIREVEKQGKDTILGYVDGQIKHLKVSDNLREAMTGMTETSSNWLIRMLAIPAKTLRVGATITPEFIIRNPLRDQWVAMIQTDVGFKPFIDTIGAIADITGQSQTYNDWIRSGGSYAGFVELSRPALGKMIDELRGKQNILRNIVMTPSNISQLMEQATRVAVFKSALKKGMTLVEAARESRESTLNFARRGSQTKELNAMIAFFNAGMQGLDKSVRTAKKDPVGFTIKGITSITLPSLFFYLMNRNEPEYYDLPRWERDLFWMFKLGNTWVRIPKPFAYGQIFGSLPERFFEFADTRNPKSFDDIHKSILESSLPAGADPIGGMLPIAIRPIIENMFNWNIFRERPIVPMSKQRLIPSEQYTRYSTETSKALGRALNVSPLKIENLVQGWLGGSGRYALDASDKFIEFVRGGEYDKPKRPVELSDIPLIKSFVSRPGQSENVNRFYENKERIEKLHNTYNKFKKEDKERARLFREKNPEIRLKKNFNNYNNKIKKINDRMDRVVESKDLKDQEKRSTLRELEREKSRLATEANSLINSR